MYGSIEIKLHTKGFLNNSPKSIWKSVHLGCRLPDRASGFFSQESSHIFDFLRRFLCGFFRFFLSKNSAVLLKTLIYSCKIMETGLLSCSLFYLVFLEKLSSDNCRLRCCPEICSMMNFFWSSLNFAIFGTVPFFYQVEFLPQLTLEIKRSTYKDLNGVSWIPRNTTYPFTNHGWKKPKMLKHTVLRNKLPTPSYIAKIHYTLICIE